MSEQFLASTPMSAAPVARLREVTLSYGKTVALNAISLDLPAGRMTALIGPDGVGKSSLLSLVAGARAIQKGQIEVLGGDMADSRHRRSVCPRIAFMPQGLGKNLYPTLSVYENLDFFGCLFGQEAAERQERIHTVLQRVGLAPFTDWAVGQLSGGMKQKLGLCCALIHDPDFLILDEPTTGVDPLSRRQFWELIAHLRAIRPGISVVVSTAYMEEAREFDWLVMMDAGRVLACGTPDELLASTATGSLEAAFSALLPESRRRGYRAVEIRPQPVEAEGEVAIEARDLTKRFDSFTAVDHVSFRIVRGEIFGFIGSNGCGKTTTMKMLTGLLPASEGRAWVFGKEPDPRDLATRRRVGYMSQSFSLYSELTVRQNLELHARLFHVPSEEIGSRVHEMAVGFDLEGLFDALPDSLPLGHRQRLSLAVAMIHKPELLILDEPTSGVDPVARDAFWQILIELSRRDHVTIFISTHYMNEAERCDRVSLMHDGRVLASDTPSILIRSRGAKTLEEAFISYLEETLAESLAAAGKAAQEVSAEPLVSASPPGGRQRSFDPGRMFSYTRREALELQRDPLRLVLALLGSVLLLVIIGYGISMDVKDLTFAVLDRDQTTTSRDYALNIAGSRYFIERPPIRNYKELDARMRRGEIGLAIEIPPGFARDIARGRPVQVGAWIDGAMPTRAETVEVFVQGVHAQWVAEQARKAGAGGATDLPLNIETRFRYNPDVESLKAMVPAVVPLLLILIPSILAALSVVREKELGSIVNFYVTPATRLEFLLGKQIPYVVLSMLSFLLLTLFAVTVFHVPVKGSFLALTAGALLYVTAATSFGLLISTFMRSQVAALFGTAILSILPAVSFSGMIDPVSSLEGPGRLIGRLFPTTYFLMISRGTFSKGLDFSHLQGAFIPLILVVPVVFGLCVVFLKKQEG